MCILANAMKFRDSYRAATEKCSGTQQIIAPIYYRTLADFNICHDRAVEAYGPYQITIFERWITRVYKSKLFLHDGPHIS